MTEKRMIGFGGACFIIGALAFVGVFSYLAANFDYPQILDGSAAEVLPRLAGGGPTMRAIWAIYSFLPLLLIPGALAAYFAFPRSRGIMLLGLVAMVLGCFAMCLGLMRWPTIHWALAAGFTNSDALARSVIASVFDGLNLYLGNYIGEFLGEVCLSIFFAVTGRSMAAEVGYFKWFGWAGVAFAFLFLVGAFRNVTDSVQAIASVNNTLLPLWLVILGVLLLLRAKSPSD